MKNQVSCLIPFSGFYGSIHSQKIDDAVERLFDAGQSVRKEYNVLLAQACELFDTNLSYGCRSVFESYAILYVETIGREIGIELEFEELVSPREYNFSTDRIFAKLDNRHFMKKMLPAVQGERFHKVAAEWFTSRSGFISNYSPSPCEWGAIESWDYNQRGCVLHAYIEFLRDTGALSYKRQIDEIATDHDDVYWSEEIESWLCEAAEKHGMSDGKAKRALRLRDYLLERIDRNSCKADPSFPILTAV